MDHFEFEPDLSLAATIPSSWYLDPQMGALEADRIFARTWQLVGRTEQVAEPGDHFTATVAGEPLIVARTEDGSLRAFSNVCRHRAGPVACGVGRRKTLQCIYHGWTYSLEGRLLRTPEFEGVKGFDHAGTQLPPFRVEAWGPFVFVQVAPDGPSLAEMLGPIPQETAHLHVERMRLVKTHDYEVQCNWKVYVDNYLEGYHLPLVHPQLFKELDYSAYHVETGVYHSRQYAPLRQSANQSLYRRNLPADAKPEALYYWLFPNLMLNCYPDNLQINVILPLGHDRTLTRFEWYVADPHREGLAEELKLSFAFSDLVQQEDISICENVQRGLRSRTYSHGRYSVARENGVHHFHGLLSRFLGAHAKKPVE